MKIRSFSFYMVLLHGRQIAVLFFMSVNVIFLFGIVFLPGGKRLMKENDKLLYKTLKALLNESLSEQEADSLREEGYKLKNPKRKTAIAIALYKKAASGELSAIKELRSIISESNDVAAQSGKAVIFLDDISN